MLFLYYLNELKYRFLYILISFFFNFIVLFFFAKDVLFILIKPLLLVNNNFNYFIFTNMSDVLLIYLKIVFFISLILSIPVVLIQIWFFLVEGLYRYEKYFLIVLFYSFVFIFLCINFILYSYLIPMIWVFFVNFELTSSEFIFNIYYEARITDYVNFMLEIFLMFSSLLIFPLFMVLLIYFNIFKLEFFFFYRKYFYIFFLILAGFFSPPDIFSQLFIVFPIIFFYELILIIGLFLYNYLK